MTIQEILILVLLSALLGWISRKGQRENLILVFSILLIYWLQPGSTLRYMDFWLPTGTIIITILSWLVTSKAEIRQSNSNLQVAALIGIVVIGLGILRYFDLGNFLGSIHPPKIESIVLVFLPIAAILLLSNKTKQISPILLWLSFVGLIVVFILIKTPILSYKVSFYWRTLAGQTPALARSDEIRWLGYSYIAFRILHTIRDRLSGRLPDIMLREYFTFIIFYPSIVAGPIDRVENFIKELQIFTTPFHDDIVKGGERITIGLFKKFVLADSLAIISLNNQNANQAYTVFGSWILLYAFSFQIFFDFSGYTDIAIGIGRLLNISMPENFKQPYTKPNLTQFWNNWHMTLTNWFRSYFFNPLSRTLRKKKYSAIMILLITQTSTMVLVGLWHGVTINFLIWGLWHGLGLLLQNRWSLFFKQRFPNILGSSKHMSVLNVLGVLFTFHYVSLGWIWFVLTDPGHGWRFFTSLFGGA